MTMAAVFAMPGTAVADSATFGSTLQASQSVSVLNQSALQLSTAAPVQLVAPARGLITNWAVRSGDAGTQYELAVIHHATPGSLSGSVKAIDIAFPPVPDASDSIRPYNAGSQVVVDKGDSIALATVAGPGALPFHNSGNTGDVYGTYGGGVFSPGTGLGPPAQGTGRELLVQATEHFCSVPALRGLTRAIAQQQLFNHGCGSSFRKRGVRKRRKRGKVLSQDIAPGTDALPQTIVHLVIGKKRKHH
jgi:hypothetical protein